MMNTQEATQAQRSLTYPVGKSEEARAAREDYYEQVSGITGQFRDWLANEYASEFPKEVQNLIFGKAWEDGHSSGYYEVENRYIDYADFAEKVRLLFQR